MCQHTVHEFIVHIGNHHAPFSSILSSVQADHPPTSRHEQAHHATDQRLLKTPADTILYAHMLIN